MIHSLISNHSNSTVRIIHQTLVRISQFDPLRAKVIDPTCFLLLISIHQHPYFFLCSISTASCVWR